MGDVEVGSGAREGEPFAALGKSVAFPEEQEKGDRNRRKGCSHHCDGTRDGLSSIIHSFILVETNRVSNSVSHSVKC